MHFPQKMRQPGIEPGSTAWKAAMLTTIPLTLRSICIVHIYQFVPLSTDLKTENFPNPGSLTQKVPTYKYRRYRVAFLPDPCHPGSVQDRYRYRYGMLEIYSSGPEWEFYICLCSYRVI